MFFPSDIIIDMFYPLQPKDGREVGGFYHRTGLTNISETKFKTIYLAPHITHLSCSKH